MKTIRLAVSTLCLVGMLLQSGLGHAQPAGAYPTKPIRIIVPFPPGGANDIIGRYMAQRLSARLGQPAVIDNRAGADAIIGTSLAASAAPDGHTLLVASTTFTMTPALHRKLPYDPQKSLTPVALIATGPNTIAAWPGLQANSIKELIALAKAKPGQLNYASSSAGGVTNFAGELFKVMAGVNIVHVTYKGGGPAMTAVMGGEVPLIVNTLLPVIPLAKSGRLKILGVTTAKRTAILPDVPAIAETVPGYEAAIWWSLLGPAGMPRDLVTKINSEVASILAEPETVKWFTAQAAEPSPATPDELRKRIASELVRWSKVAKETGITLQ